MGFAFMKTNDIATALEIELGRAASIKPDKVPPGWRMSTEWADVWKLAKSQTGRIISVHLKSGRMEAKTFRRECLDGRTRPYLHYRAVR